MNWLLLSYENESFRLSQPYCHRANETNEKTVQTSIRGSALAHASRFSGWLRPDS
jgi:hypothetical protein